MPAAPAGFPTWPAAGLPGVSVRLGGLPSGLADVLGYGIAQQVDVLDVPHGQTNRL